jgi:hypothetical protein
MQVTASMFASNFIIYAASAKHLRGQDKLSQWSTNKTIATGHTMTNYFCSVCGTLMYRVSSAFDDQLILRIGTVDDFSLHDTKLKPRIEQFVKSRVSWLDGVKGAEEHMEGYFK